MQTTNTDRTQIQKGLKILLVEDNPGDARLIKEMLRETGIYGFEILNVLNLVQAIECLTKNKLDIILLDLNLPDSFGIPTVEKINERFPDLPIVVLTGLGDEMVGEEALQCGAQDYLNKSDIDNRILLRTIRYSIERKKIWKGLKESEQRFRTMIEKNSDGIIITDKQGIVLFVNPTAEILLNKSSQELLNVNYGYPIVAEESIEIRVDKNTRLISTLEMRAVETEWEGKEIYLITLRDITEQKQSQEAVSAERQRFNNVVEMLPAALVLLDSDYKVTLANKYYRDRFGDIDGKKCYRYLWERDEPCEKCETKCVFETGKQCDWEWIGPDGRDYRIHDFPFTEVDGSPRILKMGIDITDHKRAEDAVKLANAYNRSIIEANLDPMIIINPKGIIVDVNVATELITGEKRDKLIGSDFSLYFTEQEKAISGFNKVISSGWIRDYSLTMRNNLGKETEVLFNATVYNNKDGRIEGVLVAARDITELKKSESELSLYRMHLEELVKIRTKELALVNKNLNDEIEKEKQVELLLQESLDKEKEVNELKTRFLSTTSHEFRTPLTSILSSMQLIQRFRKKWSDDTLEDHFAKIKYSIQNMTHMLDDVLTLSRSETGKLSFEPQLLDLHKFCLDTIIEVEHFVTDKHKFIFNYSLKENEFKFDPKLISIILLNLFSNAFKYSPDGGKIEFNVKLKASYILFSVKDEGIGVPAEDIEHLFEPFHRAKNTGEISGSGLGLSIVIRAVEMHKGEIKFNSKLGKGTEFIFHIPLEKE
jgi:PAS domain S-box-containing protein